MPVSAIGGSTSSTNNLYSSSTQTLGKDDFLKLLVTQLQNQDPLNPTDSTEFVSQLAQFSSLEQLSIVNDNLRVIQLFEQSINNSEAIGFVGKNIKATGSMFELGSGETKEIQFHLNEDAAAVYIKIFNASGELIKKIEMDQMTAGEQSVVWDGTDENGNAMTSGTYSFSVQAQNKEGEIMNTAAYIEETVTGVSYHDGSTFLLAKDIEIPYSAVIEVSEPEKE